MRTYLVTRHDATVAWASAQGLNFVHKRHLDPGEIEPGEWVIGMLPVPLVVELLERGASFEALELDLPATMRGRELEASDLKRYGARLTPYFATPFSRRSRTARKSQDADHAADPARAGGGTSWSVVWCSLRPGWSVPLQPS